MKNLVMLTKFSNVLGRLALLAALAAAGTVSVSKADSKDFINLKALWITENSPITGNDLKVLGDLAQKDPEAAKLVSDAMAFLKAKDYNEMAQYFEPCASDFIAAGYTDLEWELSTKRRKIEEIAQNTSVMHTPRSDELVMRIDDFIDDYMVTSVFLRQLTKNSDGQTVLEPKKFICIKLGMNVIDSYGTFIHELTHLIRKDFTKMKDASAYTDGTIREIALQMILEPDGEVAAHKAENRSVIKVTGSKEAISRKFRPFFDDQANFIGDDATFGKALLGTLESAGSHVKIVNYDYLRDRSSRYAHQLIHELQTVMSKITFFEKSKEVAFFNADYYRSKKQPQYEQITIQSGHRYTDRARAANEKLDLLFDRIKMYNADPDRVFEIKVAPKP